MKKVKGRYVFLSDQDDIWETNKIDVMLSYLKQYDFIVSDCSIIDAQDNILLMILIFALEILVKGF